MSTIDVRLFWYAFLLYLVSFLAFTLFAAHRGRRVGAIANGLLGAGFLLHTAGVVARWAASGHAPMSNMFEYASLLAWMAVLSYLIIAVQYRRTIVGVFTTPVVVALMTCASLLPKDATKQLVPALQSYWLAIHVSLAALGEGAFAVAFAVSIMVLIQDARQRSGRRTFVDPEPRLHANVIRLPGRGVLRQPPRDAGAAVALLDSETEELIEEIPTRGPVARNAAERAGGRMPSLRTLDEINYRAVTIGYPLY